MEGYRDGRMLCGFGENGLKDECWMNTSWKDPWKMGRWVVVVGMDTEYMSECWEAIRKQGCCLGRQKDGCDSDGWVLDGWKLNEWIEVG